MRLGRSRRRVDGRRDERHFCDPDPGLVEAAACPTPIYEAYPQLDLGPEYSCGYSTVPENRTRPGSRTIGLPIARLEAASPNPKPDPIVYLAGGPGGASPLITKAARTWNRDRDVIFFVQRGTLKAGQRRHGDRPHGVAEHHIYHGHHR